MAFFRTSSARATSSAELQAANSKGGTMLFRAFISAIILMLALGVSADWLAPSLRPALAAAVGRNVDALLDARSPGARLSAAFLTKVRSALVPETPGNPGIKGPGGPRSRLIPPRTSSDSTTTDPAAEGIADLLGPLERLDSVPELGGLVANSPTLAGAQPVFAIGGPGALPAASPIDLSNSPAGTVPLPAVPEPDIWLSMLVGFGWMGAALRRRGRSTNAAVAV